MANEQKPDTPLFFCSQRNNNLKSDSGCLADKLQERMNHDELKYKVFDWLRFPLIVFVVYIHSFGKPIDFYAIDFSNLTSIDCYNLFRISISHVLTHIAVPMFFFISGFLFFNKLQEWNRTVYFGKLRKRIKTLLVPFIIWNTIKILLKVQSMIRHFYSLLFFFILLHAANIRNISE